ncbi:mRNA-decapping enzyme subunit 2 [Microbotryomycetes sp. JL221]|nr:mRNA-decapping enzyme subunit 2 [Microbotryomycetes sp. JL221]
MSSTLPEENVWDYPRPPALEPVPQRLQVIWVDPQGKETKIADTTSGYRVLETSHPPSYYFPPKDVRMDLFTQSNKSSFCEWKGRATYFDFHPPSNINNNSSSKANVIPSRVWSYPEPTKGTKFSPIANYLSFYATPSTSQETVGTWKCFVQDEQVKPQDGDFYGSWITSNLHGKMKGGPGTWGW